MKKILAIYNANGGFFGEVAYVLGKLKGTVHCALCDITHGYQITGKPEWKKYVSEFPIPIETLHINEMDAKTKEFVGNNTPIVLLLEDDTFTVLLDKDELESCDKDPLTFFKLLKHKLS